MEDKNYGMFLDLFSVVNSTCKYKFLEKKSKRTFYFHPSKENNFSICVSRELYVLSIKEKGVYKKVGIFFNLESAEKYIGRF